MVAYTGLSTPITFIFELLMFQCVCVEHTFVFDEFGWFVYVDLQVDVLILSADYIEK